MANAKKKRSLTKPNVISFRLSEAHSERLHSIYEKQPPVHVKSAKRLARKIVCDFIEGRLKYINPKHAAVDLDILGETTSG